nr:GAF domain-containing protein [Anaerolineae bacterium]
MTDDHKQGLPHGALDAIYEAALTITSELSLPIVLNRIVALARDLVQARYAALGIPDESGSQLVQFITSGMLSDAAPPIGSLPQGKGLLGELLKPEAGPLRISRLEEHELSAGFPDNHPIMHSFLGVPIRSRGALLGTLYLTDKIGANEFSEQDERMMEMLAGYAAVAIENARLYQKVQRLAILEERERIGMDLHDGIIQAIYAVGLTLEHLDFLIDEDSETAHARLSDAISNLNYIIKDIRNYILDLLPQRFEGTNLSAVLSRLVREFQLNTLASVNLEYHPSVNGQLDATVSMAALHITQEALANAAKHAAATHVDVTINIEDRMLVVGIKDNGRGFEIAETEERIGHGLSNMQMRARSAGGQLHVSSMPGKGTEVMAYLPIRGAASN